MAAKITKMRAVTAVVVLGAAAGSGYFMQSGVKGAQPAPIMSQAILTTPLAPSVAPEAPALPIIEEVTRSATQPTLAITAVTPDLPEASAQEMLILASTNTDTTQESPRANIEMPVASCEAGFTATAAPGAMVELTLEAPCYSGQSVDIFHGGLRFSHLLNDAGILQITLPAMEEDAFFNAHFSDGHTESTDILMLTVTDYMRVALAWQGQAGFALYALENGAQYGDVGHVGIETPYDYTRAIAGEGGFLTHLGTGENAYQAVVYSYPVALFAKDGVPEISIEAEVLASTCGQEISATLVRNSDTGTLDNTPLFMAVPGCDAVGEYLVLKNLPQNLRLASN